MKSPIKLQVLFALFLAAAFPLAATAQLFSDNFTTGSTLDQAPTATTPTSTSYESAMGLSGGNNNTNISAHDLQLTLPNSTSVLGELFGLFTNSPFSLSAAGDYINLTVVFVNTSNLLSGGDTGNSTLNIGLFNSGGVKPNQGNITLNTGTTSGGTQGWLGFVGRTIFSGTGEIFTRPAQTANGTTSQNQDLLFNNASGTQAFNAPQGSVVPPTKSSTAVTLVKGNTYTLQLMITLNDTLNDATSLTISNALYNGTGTGGTVVYSLASQTNANIVTSGFDGMAIGWRNSGASQNSTMDISQITVTGQSTPPNGPPFISSQPVPVTVPNGASCAFLVSATGSGLSYQWHRHGTNLIDGPNISGSTSSTLIISPAGTPDLAPLGVNGYYVTVTGAGNYSTNSVTNSLAFVTATNLIWTDNSSVIWDLNNSVNWQDINNNPTVFNFGDPVTFNDIGTGGSVILTGPYLSAASVTVNSTYAYNFSASSSGSFAGPGNLIYSGTGQLTIGNVNTYSGGTIISNASAVLILANQAGLGSGPVTLAKAGGQMKISTAGGNTTGINGNIIVNDNFTIEFDGLGTQAGVLFGNLSGISGKTLTLNQNPGNSTTNERVRVYGNSTTYNANLVLNGSLITLAPYEADSQTYNGVISGPGGLIQRGAGITILNGTNTYSGGTTPSAGVIGFGTSSNPIGTGPLYLAPEVPGLTGNGTVLAYGAAQTIANAIQYPSGTNNLTLVIGGTNALTFTGPFTLNGNDALGTATLRLLQVSNTALTTLSGVISDNGAGFGLAQIGPGVLALNNTETYIGATAVSNGTLQVNGTLNAGSAVTVSSNATLSGSGTINGTVSINAGGALAPGAASIGQLTINNSVAIAGNVKARINRSGFVSDNANVIGTLNNTGTGTVIVTNTGAALHVGDTFFLFNKLVTGGANLKVVGAAGWNNQLAVNGSIIVTSTNSAPTITNAVTGPTSLTLGWPAGYTGWLVQSNSVSLTSTNWFNVPNSGNANTIAITINPVLTNGVFYRLVLPQ